MAQGESNVAESEGRLYPELSILCDRVPMARVAAATLSILGMRSCPTAPLKLVLDAPPSYALHALEELGGGDSRTIVVTWNECAEHMEDLWDLRPDALIAGEYYDRDAAAVLSQAIDRLPRGRYRLTPWQHVRLAKRERPLLRYTACGLTNSEIAKRLGTTEQVVSNRLTEIYRKIGVRNRAEATQYYWDIGYSCGHGTGQGR